MRPNLSVIFHSVQSPQLLQALADNHVLIRGIPASCFRVGDVRFVSFRRLKAAKFDGARRSLLRNCMEITFPFRVPLAVPVFFLRRGHCDSALAEPVAHRDSAVAHRDLALAHRDLALAEPVLFRTKRTA